MKEYEVLPYSKMFSLFNILNKENKSDHKAVAIREIDLSSVEKVRNSVSERSDRPTYTAFVAKAISKVLLEMPEANRSVSEGLFSRRVFRFLKTHVSVAVERNDPDILCGGAFLYTIYNTDQKTLIEMTKEISGLSQAQIENQDPRLERWIRMKEGVRLAPFIWMLQLIVWIHKNIPSYYIKNRGGAAMISSPSKYGVDFIVANWPYTIGVSFGLAKERPWVDQGQLVVRKTMPMTLSFDRRIIPGAIAAKFMNRLCEILENAEKYLS